MEALDRQITVRGLRVSQDVRLALITKVMDEYHILQGLQDESTEDDERFYCYQRWGIWRISLVIFSFPPVSAESLKVRDGSGFQGSLGKTGSPGSKKIDGPFSEERCFADIAYSVLPSLIWRWFCHLETSHKICLGHNVIRQIC